MYLLRWEFRSVFNLIPLSALGGGRLFFLNYRTAIRRKPIDPEKEGMVHFIGLVICDSAYVGIFTFNDILIYYKMRKLS